jgi:hypothetical protein
LWYIDISTMSMNLNYLISIHQDDPSKKEVIHDPESKLKVKVFNLIKSTFTPKKGEVQFFVTAGKKTFAFETEGFKKHRELLILQMISWYCVYLGLFEAQIHSTWP